VGAAGPIGATVVVLAAAEVGGIGATSVEPAVAGVASPPQPEARIDENASSMNPMARARRVTASYSIRATNE